MDHLPYPDGPSIPPLEIPFYPQYAYDGRGVEDFQVRQNLIDPENGGWLGLEEPADMAAFLQAWLWFGLLESFLDAPIDKRAFVRHRDAREGGPVLCTSLLQTELESLTSRTQPAKSDQDRVAELQRQRIALDVVLGHYNGFDQSVHVHDDDKIRLVLFSVGILLDSLYRAHQEWRVGVARGKGPRDEYDFAETTILPPAAWRHSQMLLRGRFARAGWCARQAEQYLTNPSQFTYPALYYLSSLRRLACNGLAHDTCTRSLCTTDNISGRDYHPAHAPGCCAAGCPELEVDLDQVKAVLHDGGIPVVEMSVSRSGEVTLQVDRVRAGMAYTAISHVWSHGLGNKRANAMLPCQLRCIHRAGREARKLRRTISHMDQKLHLEIRRNHPGDRVPSLSETITSFSRKLYFWIDTLCVPGDLKQQAIDRMSRTYSGARDIMIVDGELRQINRGEISEAEVLARVYSSTWVRRCWTLQEGLLAPQWFVLFKDGPAYVTALYAHRSRDLEKRTRGLIDFSRFNLQALRARLGHIGQFENDRVFRFHYIWNDLRQRSTSVEVVRNIIFGTLLNLSAFGLQNLPDDETRLRAILRSQKGLPLGLLTLKGARMGDGGDGGGGEQALFLPKAAWAPACIHSAEPLPDEWPVVRFNPSTGLTVRLSKTSPIMGILLPADVATAPQVLLRELDGTPRLWIHPREATGESRCRRAAPGRETLILLSNVPRNKDVKKGGMALVGARLSVSVRKDGRIEATYVCPVEVWTADPEQVAIWSDDPRRGPGEYVACLGQVVDAELTLDCGASDWPILEVEREDRAQILTDGQYPGEYAFRVVGPAVVALVCFILLVFVPENLPIRTEYAIAIWAVLGLVTLACGGWSGWWVFTLRQKEKRKYQRWVESFTEDPALGGAR